MEGKMKIAIIGYGRMGREIKKRAQEHGIEVVSVIDPVAVGVPFKDITSESLEGADVAIEFTSPEAAVSNIEKAAKLGVNMVVGTTGWTGDVKKVRKIVEDSGIGFIYAPNFSVGVNVFYEVVKHASILFDKLEDYDVLCHEWHHKGKVDSPSGTARKIAQTVLSEMKRKDLTVYQCLNRKRESGELHVSSTRGGWVPGTHEVVFDSEFDSIELVHRARNRDGLAAGALKAAGWIEGKKGFYEFADFLQETLGL
jgi:4-hydroxy-tetrahydrodipicolinate reductase